MMYIHKDGNRLFSKMKVKERVSFQFKTNTTNCCVSLRGNNFFMMYVKDERRGNIDLDFNFLEGFPSAVQ